MANREFSIVEYYAEHEGYRCGYCKSTDSNYSHGMWAHSLSVDDYQDLIDRGWRRSGRYCYKPTMHITCCPMYTIRCAALDFKISRSQKKVLKKLNRFLAYGEKKSLEGSLNASTEPMAVSEGSNFPEIHPKALQRVEDGVNDGEIAVNPSLLGKIGLGCLDGIITDSLNKLSSLASEVTALQSDSPVDDAMSSKSKKLYRQGLGLDNNRPPCKKAKQLRLERKQQKLLKQGLNDQQAEAVLDKGKGTAPQEKSLEEFIKEGFPDSPAHRLETTLIKVGSGAFTGSLPESRELYAKYQIAVHGEKPEECNAQAFYEFLVNSPLDHEGGSSATTCFGSFHQQYWLDGRLIAVGVIDILPTCISSVYFYYDPDLGHLSLGTYASLQELALTRSLHRSTPSLQYYYMGFYIHSCPKMRYKASYSPSFLLCPETYSWNSIERCLPKLDNSKYSRLDDNLLATDLNAVVNINDVLVLSHQQPMLYQTYRVKKRNVTDMEEVHQYATLVGMRCARRMLLFRG